MRIPALPLPTAARRPRLVCVFLLLMLLAAPGFASTPAGATISSTNPTVSWSGGPFLVSNPLDCPTAASTCDHFALTITAPKQDFVVTVRIAPTRTGDDLDLHARDANGNEIASSSNPSGFEEFVLFNPPSGTYTVEVQPFLVVPGGGYSGTATLGSPAKDQFSNCYQGAVYTADFAGVPSSSPARCTMLTPEFKVSSTYVGRGAAEPTVGVNRNNIAFFAASDFDFPTASAPAQTARTLVMRSTDKNQTWQSVSPSLTSTLADDDSTSFPPTSLDPYVYMDVVGANPASNSGRVFSFDLDAACGGNAIWSDNDGNNWTEVPLFACAEPVNDHQTMVTAPPPPGMLTVGYPSVIYVCYNRVSDVGCVRSNDGGLNFLPAAPAFTGTDPLRAGSVCGSLEGHLAADSQGRIFLPTGACGFPRVAISSDGALTWTQVAIAHVPMADHEVTLGVDKADNIYAVFQDATFRLPFLSVSRDHGATWSTPIMIAPPGVHEADMPTIVAGDAGRIAILFPGSTSSDFTDGTRPWNLYIALSINALEANPTFIWTLGNDSNDPVHRGDCGPGRCDAADGGSMFDFLSEAVSPADGALWGTLSDTCLPDADFSKDCVHNPQATPQRRPGVGVAIRQTKGPTLLLK